MSDHASPLKSFEVVLSSEQKYMQLRERLSNHLHATVYKGASAYILASKTTIAVDSPWVSCNHPFRLLGHIGLTNTQGCSVFLILMGLS